MSQLIKRGEKRVVKKHRKNIEYWEGGEGFIKWCEEFGVCVEVAKDGVKQFVPIKDLSREPHPVTGRSQWEMWEELQKIAREALKMRNGRFVYRLIVLCWMRGEAKSALVCLIICWLFFNFPAQQIMLSANTKDQSTFVHFDIIANIIRNSPRLIGIVGSKNILDKKIRLLDNNGNVVSTIQSISSYIGILSNITCFTFSEMFKMKDPKFYTELYGSIRNIPNALGLIDSTVAPITHILYKLYQNYITGKSKLTYFSYRCSLKGDYRDFWNPEMTKDQLDDYSENFPEQEYNMYFKNTWAAASEKMISPQMIECMHHIGIGGNVGGHGLIMDILGKVEEIKHKEGLPDNVKQERISKLKSPLVPVKKLYTLSTEYNMPRSATIEDLKRIGDQYDTNWAVLAGIDRADPMKDDITAGARTILTLIAKGLPGSISNPMIEVTSAEATKYIYFLLQLHHIVHSDMKTIKRILEKADLEYNGINTLCTERAGMWDIGEWCEENSITGEIVAPSYVRQRDAFAEFYLCLKEGRFKTPELVVKGSKEDDIFVEELSVFEHDTAKKVYYSPEKTLKRGIQDDSIYAVTWGIYGGRFLTSADFRPRMKDDFFSAFYNTQKSFLVGDY